MLHRPSYQTVAHDQNVSGTVNADCAAAHPADKQWKCFMAQYTLPHIKTPNFIVNSFYDAWQAGAILHMPPKCYGNGCSPLGAACPAAAKTAVATMRRDMIGNQTAGSNKDSCAFLGASPSAGTS